MKRALGHRKTFDRRRFISKAVRLAVLAGIVAPLQQACNNNAPTPGNPGTDEAKNKSKSTTHSSAKQTKRRKWNQEKLIVNTKTNIAHLPTATVYMFYDEIKHVQDININSWENQVQGQVRLNKDQSGNILEILCLQKLRNGVNNDSLNTAINTLTKAFGKECENSKGINHNSTNYRLHELMLQLIALSTTMPDKWNTFNEKVRKPQKIGRRQKWMETEPVFSERVKYILERQADYKKRLSLRASKYSLT